MRALAALALTGCLSSAPLVPVTPQNAAQIAACQATWRAHGWLVIGAAILGPAGAAQTGVSALDGISPGAKTGLEIGSAGTVLAGATLGVVAAYEASSYAGVCMALTGPLPAAAPKPVRRGELRCVRAW